MENVWALAALWVGLALVATLVAIWFKISTALSEIVVGTVGQLIIGAFIMSVLTNGLRILSVAQEWQFVVTGVIIILAVYADILRRKRA